MTQTPARQYVLGTHEPELQRLGLQHQLWSEQAHALWERARLGPGRSVLDLGCGPGYAAMDLAQLVGSHGRVVGIDEAPHFVEFFNRQAELRGLPQARAFAGDVGAALDVTGEEPGSFNAVYARWLFCFISNVEETLDTAVSALAPDGALLVQDYFNYETLTMAPRSEAFRRVIEATSQAWRSRGGNPDVMGTLPTLAARRGLRIEHIGVHQRLARPGETMWAWPKTFWRNFMPVLIEMDLLTSADAEAFWVDFEAMEGRSAEAGGFMVLPPVFELVARRK